MKNYTITIQLRFPITADEETVKYMMSQLPATLKKDLSYMASLCVDETERSKGGIEVEVKVEELK